MTKLFPNTIEGLTWGLQNFDGIETDVRLGKDNIAIIHHDAMTKDSTKISDLNEEQLKKLNIPLFRQFLNHEITQNEVKSGKYLWIEFKPNCDKKKPVKSKIAESLYQSFVEEVEQSKLPKNKIRILSFAKELLEPARKAQEFKVYPILPYVNECNSSLTLLKGLTRVLMKSMKSHIKDAQKKEYGGLLFARQYIVGLFRYRHPSYTKMLKLIETYDLELGSNLGQIELEPDFKEFHRFSDKTYQFPRHSGNDKAQIIAHRGTGTKGVEIN